MTWTCPLAHAGTQSKRILNLCFAAIFPFILVAPTFSNAQQAGSVKSVVTFAKGTQADLFLPYPSFRVEVFSDRTAVYEGFYNVRLVGKHRYQLTASEYQSLIAAVDHVFSTSESSIRDPRWTLGSVKRSSGAAFYFGFTGRHGHIELMRTIERHLRTTSLRCPAYSDNDNQRRDACESETELENTLLKRQ
jgi:hypothetical protein